jgi:hypothetical protein
MSRTQTVARDVAIHAFYGCVFSQIVRRSTREVLTDDLSPRRCAGCTAHSDAPARISSPAPPEMLCSMTPVSPSSDTDSSGD